ncbi:Cystathionine beta-lyase [Planctomycetes bacterium Poly30]|uniref:Cystathionine beta-lyase n=1 Tax=Saltatorellus ferox TaxID=2528018 RepID=A0A518EUM5_9BACT|nr:Cystathionine beta-lyase [Planctomycetes bacterium Poly30]
MSQPHSLPKDARFETRAIHAGQGPDPRNGAVMTPVYLTSTYAQDAPTVTRGGYEYSRTSNPTRTALEENLASLENGEWGLCFASGLAATNAVMDRLVPGDHVVAGNDLYGGTYRIFTKVFQRYGIEFTFVDTTEADNIKAAMRPDTKYVYIETPSNPLLNLTDIAKAAEITKNAGTAKLVVDNTFATPYLQQPLDLGADIVLHSLSKYLGGHSDLIGGALVGRDEKLREELAFYQNSVGGCLAPLDAFLVLRGTKTLGVRMDRHCANATKVAEFLAESDLVDRVIYPGLPNHPQLRIAQAQMAKPGGMLSFELKGGVEAANAFASATKIFTLAESLGGVESLVEVPPSMTHASIPAEVRRAAGLADGLVRLSVGLEHMDDLVADVEQALEVAARTAGVTSNL